MLSSVPYVSGNKLPPFSHFLSVYLEALNEYNKTAKPLRNLKDELEYQKGLKELEMTSIREIEAKGLFKGVKRESVVKLAEKIQLKPGFLDFMANCNKPVKVLSINWTSILINAIFSKVEHKPEVLVNELEFVDGTCLGKFDPKINIRTGYDKWTIMEQLKRKDKIVYIGDSRTDLAALLASDVGIVIEGGSLLTKLPWEVSIQSLDKYPGTGLYTGNWQQITDFLKRNF